MKRDMLEEHDQRINGVLRKAFEGHGWTPVDDHTPLDAMMDAEPEFDEHADAPEGSYYWPSEERQDLELSALKHEEALQVAAHAREQMARWIAGGGFHPFRIVQRFYALCYARYGSLLGPLNGTDLADILGQGRAAFSATMKALFGKPVADKLGVILKVPGQKSANSYAAYAANAAKHKPRQQLDGVDVDSVEEQARENQSKAEAQKRLQEQRAAALQRELERDAATHLAMTQKARISNEDITLRDAPKHKKTRKPRP